MGKTSNAASSSDPQRLPPLEWEPEHSITKDTVIVEIQKATGLNGRTRRSVRISRNADGRQSAFLRPTDLDAAMEAIVETKRWLDAPTASAAATGKPSTGITVPETE